MTQYSLFVIFLLLHGTEMVTSKLHPKKPLQANKPVGISKLKHHIPMAHPSPVSFQFDLTANLLMNKTISSFQQGY